MNHKKIFKSSLCKKHFFEKKEIPVSFQEPKL